MRKYRFAIRKSFYDDFTIKYVEAESAEEADAEIREFCYNAGYTDYRRDDEEVKY